MQGITLFCRTLYIYISTHKKLRTVCTHTHISQTRKAKKFKFGIILFNASGIIVQNFIHIDKLNFDEQFIQQSTCKNVSSQSHFISRIEHEKSHFSSIMCVYTIVCETLIAARHSLQRLLIELMRVVKYHWVIACHSACSICIRCWLSVGSIWLLFTRQFSSSQMCSVELWSGLHAGQYILLTPACGR